MDAVIMKMYQSFDIKYHRGMHILTGLA